MPVSAELEQQILAGLATPAREMTGGLGRHAAAVSRVALDDGNAVSRRLIVHDAARADVDHIAAGISTDAGLRFYDAAQRTFEFLAEYPNVGTRRSAADPSLTNLRS